MVLGFEYDPGDVKQKKIIKATEVKSEFNFLMFILTVHFVIVKLNKFL